MTARAAHRRPGLIRRVTNGLFVTADRIRNALFWIGYRAAEVSPWTRMAHRDSEQHERRIEQLEADVARLTRTMQTCVDCIRGLTELSSDQS